MDKTNQFNSTFCENFNVTQMANILDRPQKSRESDIEFYLYCVSQHPKSPTDIWHIVYFIDLVDYRALSSALSYDLKNYETKSFNNMAEMIQKHNESMVSDFVNSNTQIEIINLNRLIEIAYNKCIDNFDALMNFIEQLKNFPIDEIVFFYSKLVTQMTSTGHQHHVKMFHLGGVLRSLMNGKHNKHFRSMYDHVKSLLPQNIQNLLWNYIAIQASKEYVAFIFNKRNIWVYLQSTSSIFLKTRRVVSLFRESVDNWAEDFNNTEWSLIPINPRKM